MKIFLRPEHFVPSPQLNWPCGFENFLRVSAFTDGTTVFQAEQTADLVTVPHGGLGARVVCLRERPLAGAWRVSAFHSDQLAEMSSFDISALAKADGLVVKGKNFHAPLAISTADCLAVAMTFEKDDAIQLATCFHAGWRGYTAGIQQNAVQWMMGELGLSGSTDREWIRHLHVTVGPAIAGVNYPCGADVMSALTEHLNVRLRTLAGWSERHDRAFMESLHPQSVENQQSEKIFPDLQVLLTLELSALGLPADQLSLFREDTFASSWWPSHRRAMSQGLASAGRLVTHLCPAACPQVHNRVSNP